MINAIVDTSEKIMAERPDMIDVHQRQLARVLEKVGGLADIPAASVALEFERIKMLRKMHEK
jgi:hypothetical protein